MIKTCLFIYVGQPDMDYALSNKRDYELKREPQIGFAYLSAVLRPVGVEAEILDFTIKKLTPLELNNYIAEKSPLFVGFYTAQAIKQTVIEYIATVRQKFRDLKILAGGADSYDCVSYLNNGCDLFCLGEGERTILEIAAYCRGNIGRSQIKGVAFKEKDEVVYAPPQPIIENLDELPIPAWDKYDLSLYHDFHVFDMATPYTSIMASRGCPFSCTFCVSHQLWKNRYRRRSPRHVMAEIDYLVNKLDVRYLTFQDDIWSWQDDGWAREVCRQLIERKYKLKWRSILHPLSFLRSRREILPLMKAAGCSSISTGLQSASQKILQNIKRSPQEPEALAELIDIMKKNKIINNTAFIFGLPGETEETIEESIRYALRIKPTFAAFYALSVLQGSEIWEMEKEGKFNKLSDDYLRIKCRNASRRFYTNPFVISSLFKFIIQANPKWIFRGISHLKYLADIAGVSKTYD